MTTIRKYMFDTAIFDPPLEEVEETDAADAKPPEPVEPPPPSATMDEVQRARREAFDMGKQAALEEAEFQHQQANATALSHVASVADHFLAREIDAYLSLERDIVAVAIGIAKRLFPTLAERGTLDELRTLADTHLSSLQRDRQITIALPTGTREEITSDLREVLASRGLEESVRLIEDPALEPSDCRISWGDGGVERLTERVWEAVEDAAARALAATREAADAANVASAGDEPTIARAVSGGLSSGGPPVRFTGTDPYTPPPGYPPELDELPSWLSERIESDAAMLRQPAHIGADSVAHPDDNPHTEDVG